MGWNTQYSVYTWRDDDWIVVAHAVSKHDVRNIVRAWPQAHWKVMCGEEMWTEEGTTADILRRLANGPFK